MTDQHKDECYGSLTVAIAHLNTAHRDLGDGAYWSVVVQIETAIEQATDALDVAQALEEREP